MTKAISKLCAGLCFVGAIALAPACGGESTKSGACEDGQKEANVNGTTGCFDECQEGACAGGSSCKQGLCIADTAPNNVNPNAMTNNVTTTNNVTPNNVTPNNVNPNNVNPNNTTIDPATQALCEQYADLLFGSCFDSCTLDAALQADVDAAYDGTLNGDGTAQNPSCARLLTDNPQFVTQVQDFVANSTCASLSTYRCGELGLTTECGCTAPSNLGAACTADTDCNGGSLNGACLAEADGGGPGGSCYAGPCPSSTQAPDGYIYNEPDVCGAGNVCLMQVEADMSASNGFCLAGCTTGSCGAGQSCQIANIYAIDDMGGLEVARTCGDACAANADCSTTDVVRCNTANGACELDCDGAPGMNGAASNMEVCIATGGTCTPDAAAGKDYCVY